VNEIDEVHRLIFQGRSQELSKLLIEHPDLAQARNADNDMPIHSVCWAKQVGMLGILFAHNVDLNARGCYGRTPLHYAVHEGHKISVPLVAALMAHGADPSVRDDSGFTPADWAKIEMDEGLPEVLDFLGDCYALRGRGERNRDS